MFSQAVWAHSLRLLATALVGLGGLPYAFSAETILSTRKADLEIQLSSDASFGNALKLDFDGDGVDDVALGRVSGVDIIRGHPDFSAVDFNPGVFLTILLPTSLRAESMAAGDLNGDGREDMILGYPGDGQGPGEALVVYGRPITPGTLDLTGVPADFKVLGKANSGLGKEVAAGDFNGDGFDDLLLGTWQNVYEAYIVWGSQSLSGTVDLNGVAPGSVLRKVPNPLALPVDDTWFPRPLQAGDINGDGKADIVLSAPQADVEGVRDAGECYVLWGRENFPPLWDLNVASADVTIQGKDTNKWLWPYGIGDFDGDSKGDLVLYPWGPNVIYPGSFLSSGVSTLSTRLASIHYNPGIQFAGKNFQHYADFDGDRKDDIIVDGDSLSSLYPHLSAILTTDDPSGWTIGETLSLSFSVQHYQSSLTLPSSLADLNADGFADLLISYPPKSWIIYGHQPLKNPAIGGPVSVSKALVPLTLSVSGQPTEMMVGGDILDSFKDQWIPYAARKAVTLTGANGNKTVTARFRNKFRRESDSAAKGIELAAAGTQPEATTTRLRKGGRAMVQCSMGSGGRLKAAVWTSEGTKVVEVMDEEKGPGVWVVEWDGRNGEGRRVAPGVYILEIEIDGRADRKKILVQG